MRPIFKLLAEKEGVERGGRGGSSWLVKCFPTGREGKQGAPAPGREYENVSVAVAGPSRAGHKGRTMAASGTPSRMSRSGSSSRLAQLGSNAALPGTPSVAGVALASGMFLSCVLSVLFVAGLPTRSLISNEKPTTWSALGTPDRCSASDLSSLSNRTDSGAAGAGCAEEQAQKEPDISQGGTGSPQQIGAIPNAQRNEPSEEDGSAAAGTGALARPYSAAFADAPKTRKRPETARDQVGDDLGSQSAHTGSAKDLKYHQIPITVLPDTETSGVCLDGSPPAYHLRRGQGSGSTKWVVFLEGGGWCTGAADCRKRSRTRLGSSRHMRFNTPFGGILSNSSYWNPFFHDWNGVFVRYCDGASFAGTLGPKASVTTDGQRLFERVVHHLLQVEGMRHATHALLAGCSAGGLAALLHCDQFKSLLLAGAAGPGSPGGDSDATRDDGNSGPSSRREPSDARGRRLQEGRRDQRPAEEDDLGMARGEQGSEERPVVKCLSDAGFFPDIEDVRKRRTLRKLFADVVAFHQPRLSRQCTEATGAGDSSPGCFFAENFINFLQTPTFILNPLYDQWLIREGAIPRDSNLSQEWMTCREDIQKCSEEQLSHFHGYRSIVLDKLANLLDPTREAATGGHKPSHGVFLDSCRTHCQAVETLRWNGPDAPRVNNRTMAQAVASWYKEEDEPLASFDCQYPCNPTCYPHALEW